MLVYFIPNKSNFISDILILKALELATQLRDATKWSDPIENPNDSVLFAVIDPNTGVFGGGTRYSNLLHL